MTVAFSAFFPFVLPNANGVPDTLAEQAILHSAIDFCMQTDIIQQVLTASVVANQQDYTVVAPTDMKLARILFVGHEGRELVSVSPNEVYSDTALRGAAIGTAEPREGTPYCYFTKTPNTLTFSLFPIPDTALTGGLTVKASFAPTNTATTLDELLYDDWAEVIAFGALARLMSMPGQQFTSPAAASYGMAYRTAIAQGRRLKNQGQLPGSLRVTPRRFA
jgi:hypothetical protein